MLSSFRRTNTTDGPTVFVGNERKYNMAVYLCSYEGCEIALPLYA